MPISSGNAAFSNVNTDNSNDSTNYQYTTDAAVQTAYSPVLNANGTISGNTITTTDFGAIAAASQIAGQSIAALSQGYGQLNSLTGQALIEKTTPLSQNILKYGLYIVGAILGFWLLLAFIGRKKS